MTITRNVQVHLVVCFDVEVDYETDDPDAAPVDGSARLVGVGTTEGGELFSVAETGLWIDDLDEWVSYSSDPEYWNALELSCNLMTAMLESSKHVIEENTVPPTAGAEDDGEVTS